MYSLKMAKYGWFRICVFVLLTSIMLSPYTPVQAERECSARLKTPGYTDPHGDILIEYGNPLDITCVLYDKYVQEHGINSSRNLYFVRDTDIIPSEMIEIINSSSIRLHIDKPPKSSSVYTCKLKDNPTSVCLNNVVVGMKPLPVEDFECIGYNYENLTCSWTPPENYAVTTYHLTYYFPGRSARVMRYACPKIQMKNNKMSCLWTIQSDPQYRQAQRTFYFELNMTNHFGGNQLEKTFSHFQHVLSGPPENLTLVNATSDSIFLHWSVPTSMQAFPPGLQHRVIYQSEYNKEWKLGGLFTTTAAHEMKHVYFNLTGLNYAYTLYDIRVSMRSDAAEPDDELMWSMNSSFTVRTMSEVPGAPPKTNIGSFEIVSAGNTLNQREVYVYWQQILPQIVNGEDFSYEVSVKGTHSNIEVFDKPTMAYARFKNLGINESYTFHIWSKNNVGRSKNMATVFVPSQSQYIGEPRSFTKIEFGQRIYELSWEPPRKTGNSSNVKNYTIFWCRNERDRPYQCKGYLNWKEVPGNETMHNVTVPDNHIYQFAISANSENSSSGMVWAACTVIHNQAVGKMKNVDIGYVGADVIELKWKLDCSDRIGSVEGFIIYYCSIVSPSVTNCKEPERNRTIHDPSAQKVNITGLKPYETYMLAVAVITKHSSQSQKSDYLYKTTLEGAPTQPQNIDVEKVSNSSISLKWEKPQSANGKLKYYQIIYNNFTTETENEEIIISNLRSYTTYNISVVACTVECSKPTFAPLTRTKGGYPSKTNQPYVKFQNNSYILVVWDTPVNPNGNNDIYEVNFKEKWQYANKTNGIINVTGTHYGIEDCGADGKYNTFYISVRAVNIFDGKHYEGPWSDELESFCRPTPNLWIWVLVPVCLCLVLALYYMAKKMYFHCQEMRDVEVKLPSGLAPVVTRDIVLDDWSGPKTQEPSHHLSPDQESLIGKITDGQNISGDSSGCSSGHESVTSSLGSATHLSSTSDSGTEQPCSFGSTERLSGTSDSGTEQPRSSSTKDSLRQRNVGSNRSSNKGYVRMPADNANPTAWNAKNAIPGSYCVFGVDPVPITSINPSYIPAGFPQSETTKLPYILPDSSHQSSPYVVTGDLQKPSNSGYVPLNSAEAPDKNPVYVMAGNKSLSSIPDLGTKQPCSLGTAEHLSDTSDTGTEQTLSASTRDSLRQRNVGLNRSSNKGYVTMPADNVNATAWNSKSAVPGSYCVLNVEPTPITSVNPSYVPACAPQSETTKLPYILPDASNQTSPYVVTGELQKPSNSGYVPLNSADTSEKNPAYVMAGNKSA